MRPMISNTPYHKLTIPELSGGVNLRDGISLINDNQLTDVKNMWYKDGVLRTRPGVSDLHYYHKAYGEGSVPFDACKVKAHDIYKELSDETYTEICRLVTVHNIDNRTVYFFWIGEKIYKTLPSISFCANNFLVVAHKGQLYAFVNGLFVEKLDETKNEWVDVSDEEIHTPTVTINGTAVNGANSNYGTQLEPYNLLSKKYKMKFSTVDISRDENEMKYALLHSIRDHDEGALYQGAIITAEITNKDGTSTTHQAEINYLGSAYEEKPNLSDGLRMVVSGGNVYFYKGEEVATVSRSEHVENNLVITAPCPDNRLKVCQMTRSIWFGGASQGINGGTRLFLCGNKEEKNLVIWSDLDNPLYFPENNYFYVGDPSQDVTCFGKQSDMLVIFKESETYYTRYTENSSITAEQIINQSVVDIVSTSVYFPLIQIHSSIGCDCPDTVELCRNRLVWASSDGKVHTLQSANQYSERAIFQVGEMVYNRLKNKKNDSLSLKIMKEAVSCDWNGHYLLNIGGSVFVMDYNSYGYQYVSSYSKSEDANLKIPWYIFEVSGLGLYDMIFTVSGCLKTFAKRTGHSGFYLGTLNNEQGFDEVYESDTTEYGLDIVKIPIKSVVQTKLFDFGAPTVKKSIPKIELALGANGGVPIHATVITENSTDESEIVIDEPEEQDYAAGYFQNRLIRPANKRACRVGLKLECEGEMSIDAISLQYKSLGGMK